MTGSSLIAGLTGTIRNESETVVIAVATAAHAMLRPVEGPAPTRMWPPVPELERWFRETSRLPVSERARVHLYPYWNAPLWGDAVAASRVIGMLSRNNYIWPNLFLWLAAGFPGWLIKDIDVKPPVTVGYRLVRPSAYRTAITSRCSTPHLTCTRRSRDPTRRMRS